MYNITNKPDDIVHLKTIIPDIVERIDYGCKDNFTGHIIPGYKKRKAFLQIDAAKALLKVQNELKEYGNGLIIFDSYRPQKGVEFFFNEWRKEETNIKIKEKYFPTLTKEQIFKEEFLARKSSHTRCSTVDLSMIKLEDNSLVEMDGIFDFFHEKSSTRTNLITPQAQKNRILLLEVMQANGFTNYSKEWWHFRFIKEKYPETYFDFDIN